MLNLLLTLCQYDCVIGVSDVCNILSIDICIPVHPPVLLLSCVNVEQTRRNLKRAHIQACVYIYMRTCVRTRVRACEGAHVRARVGVRVCALAGALTTMRA